MQKFEDYSSTDVLAFKFDKETVMDKNYKFVKHFFDTERIAKNGKLKDLLGKVLFSVDGWDVDPRAIHEIPEIRDFYQGFYKEFPYWLYVSSLQYDTLTSMTRCLLASSTTVRNDGLTKFIFNFDFTEFHRCVDDYLKYFNELCSKSKAITKVEHRDYIYKIWNYFALPTDPYTGEPREPRSDAPVGPDPIRRF